MVTYANTSPKMVNTSDVAGNVEEEENTSDLKTGSVVTARHMSAVTGSVLGLIGLVSV